MHGWPQNHREYLPLIRQLAGRYRFIVPDLRGFADSDKPFSGYEPKTIAQDMLALLAVEGVDRFHILSHDLGGPPSVALAYLAGDRPLSLSTIETPFFGLKYPGYVDPRVAYWHLGMHMNMDISVFLIEGREDRYLRHFFRDFAYNPDAVPEDEVERYVAQMRQPGNLRASLNLYGYIPQMAEQTAELTRQKLKVPMLAWGGVRLVRYALHRQRQGDFRERRRRRDPGVRPLGLRREDRFHLPAARDLLAAQGRGAK